MANTDPSETGNGPMNILHINNPANIAGRLAAEQKKLGHQAAVLIDKQNHLGYKCDFEFGSSKFFFSKKLGFPMIRKWVREFDVVHIHGGMALTDSYVYMYRFFPRKKAVVAHFHGTDAREGGGLHHLFMCNAVLCSTPDLQKYVKATWIPNPHVSPSIKSVRHDDMRIRLGHFPTDRKKKGTDYIISSFRKLLSGSAIAESRMGGVTTLRGEGIELLIVEKCDHRKADDIMRTCDVVVDQVSDFGMYGLVSIDAMSLGEVVLSSYDPNLYTQYGKVPIIRVTERNFLEKLRKTIEQKDEWNRIGRKGIEYTKKVHDPERIAKEVVEIYAQCLE